MEVYASNGGREERLWTGSLQWCLNKVHKETESPKCELGESNGSPEFPNNGFAVQRAQAIEEIRLPMNLRVYGWEIMWSGTTWMCDCPHKPRSHWSFSDSCWGFAQDKALHTCAANGHWKSRWSVVSGLPQCGQTIEGRYVLFRSPDSN
ncbi:unnamed protein product [Microthlaspi erraticum]|uniref:Uncharacterized protein n=1 Tax=Microthlaspi erraticum TaxID=1685480 RepID=A0A6D2JUS5_9BRAS|nr:unnamed protein product [Microthlaspi erraticum]